MSKNKKMNYTKWINFRLDGVIKDDDVELIAEEFTQYLVKKNFDVKDFKIRVEQLIRDLSTTTRFS